MKLNKSILVALVFTVVFFTGLGYASAATYTGYHKGDLITVNVNDNETKEFYVLADSDEINGQVVALAKEVEGEAVSEYNTKIQELQASWNKVTSVTVPTLQELFGNVANAKSEISITEDWLKGEKAYFTSTSVDAIADGGAKNWIVNNATTANQEADGTYYVRPIVTAPKEIIDGGVSEEEASTAWTKFVETFENNKTVTDYKAQEDKKVNITHDNNSLTIKITFSEKEYTTKFTYTNGIVLYSAPESPDDNTVLITDRMWNEVAMQAVCDMFGYDYQDVLAYFDTLEEFRLNVDGIVMSKGTVNVAEKDEQYFKVLRMDIVHGFLSYVDCWNNQENPPVNPSTGLFFNTGLFAIAVVGAAGAYMFIKKKNLFPQA